jgi:hypothetical protein
MQFIYSALHQNIQDKFNEAGIEINTPHYMSLRDGNRVAIPEPFLPQDYQAPSSGTRVVWDRKGRPVESCDDGNTPETHVTRS